MAELRISADVTGVIGEDLIRKSWSQRGGYECWRCGQPGDQATPTSVIVVTSDTYPSLVWAHAECVPSMVVRRGGRLLIGAETDGPDPILRVRAVVLDRGPGRQEWPALLHEFRDEPSVRYPGRHPDVTRLLTDGLSLLGDGRALAVLAPAAGWRLELRGSRARLSAADGTVYYTGRWDAPGGWEELAGERGGCLLLSGIVGLHQRNALTEPARKLARKLDRAARAGTVAGGIVPVARG